MTGDAARRGPAWIAQRRTEGMLLDEPVGNAPHDVVRRLLAMQAQLPTEALWSVAQRCGASPAAVAQALDAGLILRTHVLRPTWHLVAATDLRWLLALTGPRVEAGLARRYRVLGLSNAIVARSERVIADSVADASLTRTELSAVLTEHGIPATGEYLTAILMHAEVSGLMCSGPSRGVHHTYTALDRRVSPAPEVEGEAALAEMALRYFATRGPATLADFSWWSGLAMGAARTGLEAVRGHLATCEMDGRRYFFEERTAASGRAPRIALIQCFDELIVSYRESRDVVRSGPVDFAPMEFIDGYRHPVLRDGRLLGLWRPVPSGGVDTRIMAPLDGATERALGRAVGVLEQAWAATSSGRRSQRGAS
jgi:hypothetical protein